LHNILGEKEDPSLETVHQLDVTWITFAVIPSDPDMSVQSRTLGRVACRTGSASCQRLGEALSGYFHFDFHFHFRKENSFQSVETDHLNALK